MMCHIVTIIKSRENPSSYPLFVYWRLEYLWSENQNLPYKVFQHWVFTIAQTEAQLRSSDMITIKYLDKNF